MEKGKYGLFTAITMITGVVIGSGIFFKSDDVLSYTNGNLVLGVLVFCIAAFAIVFGCLTVSQLATRTDKPGGIIAYGEEFVNKGTASAFGWFQMCLYYPGLIAVVSWVGGMYVCQLFGIKGSNLQWSLIGLGFIILFFIMNTLSAKLGGLFQNASMLIKLFPLFAIAIMGFIYGNPGSILISDAEHVATAAKSGLFISAFAPIAFSFDGWIVATSIGHEIKNSKRNLSIALTVAPIVILVVYVAYFLGIATLVGPETVMAQGNDSVYTAAKMIFGDSGAKIVIIFVTISVLGTLNGLVLGFIRLPYSLAIRKMLPLSEKISDPKQCYGDISLFSAAFAFFISLFWLAVHYFTQEAGMPGDVSEIGICVSYMSYIVLYIVVIRMCKRGEIKSKWKGYVVPSLAIFGAFVIISGSAGHPLFLYYMLISLAIIGYGYWYYYHRNK
ncbi:permease of the drug/metabolite transporter superfamily [Lachnospiraceae bacterium KM106-2]|nr:permease of the drug/metabolite transporter superfamily [Lachnospiraceae bacterium KM106-2]